MTLADYITLHLTAPFVWGKNDCATFAANWVKEYLGRDYLDGMGDWDTAFKAGRLLSQLGGYEIIMEERLFQRIHPNFAFDGDIALHHNCLRLFSGRYITGPGVSGLVFFNRMEAECAWRCA